MAPRRKAASINAPATITEATAAIARYLTLAAKVEEAKADADASLRAIEAARDDLVAPVEAELRDLFMQIRTWWTVARDDLTQGKRKSIELAGAILGDRTTPPSLKLPKGVKAEDAVRLLRGIADAFPAAQDLLRQKVDIEKPAVLRLIAQVTNPSPIRQRILELGFAAAQKEEFFIDRAAPVEPDPVIETEAAA